MFLVAFQKIFRKIFSGVWKRRRKTQIQKNTSHNPDPVRRPRRRLRSEIAIDGVIAISPSSRDRDRRRDLAKRRSRSPIFLSCLHTRSCDLGSSSLAVNRDLDPARDRDQRRDLAKARSRSTNLPLGSHDLPRRIFLSDLSPAQSHEGEIAINGAISRRRDRNLTTARSRPMERSRDGEIAFVASPLACARALSLSLIFRKCFEGKIEV